MNRLSAKRITPLQRLALWLAGCVLVIVFAVANIGFDLSLSQFAAPAETPPSSSAIDQTAYSTARKLAALAATPQEKQFAVLAMRAADHELDQSFVSAIRDSANHRAPATPEAALALRQAGELREAVRAGKAAVAAAGILPESTANAGGEKLREAQAQLALDQDELENVEQDLTRLGGNLQAEIQQAFDQHRSIEDQAAALPNNTATAALESSSSLHSVVGKFRILSSLQERRQQLSVAQAQAVAVQQKLQQQHDALARQVNAASADADPGSSAARVERLRISSDLEKDMADLEKRTVSLGQLVTVYGDWMQLLQSQRRSLRTALTADFIEIVMAFLGIFALSGFAQYLIKRWETRHHHRLDHARVVITLVLEAIVVTRVAVVIFGMPGDVSTIIGFITAGITVTLKDFLVSFVGWFALMGRRGIQVGDWVEIDGTQGEVAEITALHTFLLETGNWVTSGQFTGRQAVFMNKYAVERKYFNFSTPEKWSWDELVIPAPANKRIDPGLLTRLQNVVEDETRNDLASADASWREIFAAHGLHERRPTPAVVVRTSAAGLEVVVRYAARAPLRFDTAVRLRQAVLGELKLGVQAQPDQLPQTETRLDATAPAASTPPAS